MKRLMQKTMAWVVLAVGGAWMLAAMPACHTVEGAGRDVQAIGGATEDVAEEARPYDRHGDRRY